MSSFSDSSQQLITNQLSCEFEAGTGFLRKIRHGEIEILRAIYGAVRDQNWNTVEPKLTIRYFESQENQFHLRFEADCTAPGIDFSWSGLVDAEGSTLTFQFIGKAKSTFRKNRIGLCVLHPIN
jgi:D-apionolactonase